MIVIEKNKKGNDSNHVKMIRIDGPGVSSVRIGDKQKKNVIRIAGYHSMPACDRRALRLGTGFVLVPDEERARQRIDAYSYLIR